MEDKNVLKARKRVQEENDEFKRKYASAPVNRRECTLARIQDAVFKYSGRGRENHGAMSIPHLLFGV